jgi:two-component SAPR family response regulator
MTKGRTPRVLIVEDDAILALDLSMSVEDAGYPVSGPLHRLRAAMDCCLADVGIALLDVDVSGQVVFPFADRCVAAGIPVIFHTGRDDTTMLRERYPQAQILAKPSTPQQIEAAIARIDAYHGAACQRRQAAC